jgi:hypothetical protein
MWHNVIGPGGVRELLWLDRTEGYIGKFLAHQPFTGGDVLIHLSHGETNAAAIEATIYAREHAINTVAVTAFESGSRPANHSTSQRVAVVCDIVVYTCCPVEDALVSIDGWPRPVSGSSTVAATGITHEDRRDHCLARRNTPHVSPTDPGATLESNDEVFATSLGVAMYLSAARSVRQGEADEGGESNAERRSRMTAGDGRQPRQNGIDTLGREAQRRRPQWRNVRAQ